MERDNERAWIAGKAAPLDAAVAAAAKLLAASRQPLIAGLGTDVAGARAALALARQTGAVVDHMDSAALLRDVEAMRTAGLMLTTPGEAQLNADTLLLVGPGLAEAWPELPQKMFGKIRSDGINADVERRIFWLTPGRDSATRGAAGTSLTAIGKELRDLPIVLAALRARISDRPTGKTRVAAATLDELAGRLKSARFGVAVWSAASLDALTIEMLCGLVSDLNATTRFSSLPLAPADNAIGVLQTCGWTSGFPPRTGFGRGFAEHDPWLFDSRRLVASGETDCVVWISAYRGQAPSWRETPPTIALTGQNAAFGPAPRVQIQVGHPGVDHACVQHSTSTGTLVAVEASAPSGIVSVADAIARIAAALPGHGEHPC
jgi:formylmethanofuran dehydrogenase subunit B